MVPLSGDSLSGRGLRPVEGTAESSHRGYSALSCSPIVAPFSCVLCLKVSITVLRSFTVFLECKSPASSASDVKRNFKFLYMGEEGSCTDSFNDVTELT